MSVPPILIRRLKSHFVSLPCGVDLILGLNGYIWVSKHVKQSGQEGEDGLDAEAVYSNKNDVGGFLPRGRDVQTAHYENRPLTIRLARRSPV